MYSWIWRKLPGGLGGKLAGSLILFLLVVVLLYLVVFPWLEPKLPLNRVTVGAAPISNQPERVTVLDTSTRSVASVTNSVLDPPEQRT